MVAALVEALLQQVLVETTTQAHNTAELVMVLAQVLNKIIPALLVFAGTTRILFQKLLVTIRKLANALSHKGAVVVRLLQVELVIALVAIFQILAVLAQAHLKQATVVIIILVGLLLHRVLTLITAQLLFKALE